MVDVRTAVRSVALAMGLVLISAAPVSGAMAKSAPAKYYVVSPPVNGQREFLFAIAAATLGNGNRQLEIFELNRGRRQPDGRQMVDPAIIEPGWVLLLPPDATGPGVVSGDPPTAGPPAPARAAPAADAPGSSMMDVFDVVSLLLLAVVAGLVGTAAFLLLRRRAG